MASALAQTTIPFFNYRGAFSAREEEFIEIIRDVLAAPLFSNATSPSSRMRWRDILVSLMRSGSATQPTD